MFDMFASSEMFTRVNPPQHVEKRLQFAAVSFILILIDSPHVGSVVTNSNVILDVHDGPPGA